MKINSILNANINVFKNEMAKAARNYKDVAETMVFEQGLRGDVDKKFIRKILPDYFDKTGNLTETGRQGLKDLIADMFSKKTSPEKVSVQKFFNELYRPLTRKMSLSLPDEFVMKINR